MNFKKKLSELIACFKTIKSFDFAGRAKNLTKDIAALVALGGGTFMFFGSFMPYVSFLGEPLKLSIAYNFGWTVFLLTTVILGLAFLKQTFWAGLTAGLCFTITFIQGITLATTPYLNSSVGFWFIILGELAVGVAFVLDSFVFNKANPTDRIEVEATPVEDKTEV